MTEAELREWDVRHGFDPGLTFYRPVCLSSVPVVEERDVRRLTVPASREPAPAPSG
ncbi:MAG TPA: hypothetical protein VK488_03795 [Gaiellaceae bacterium]|nr:hypothetical protein [Gaiellaceae bacterium]